MSLSGDRHLRPEPSGNLKGLIASPRTILICADGSYAATFPGQVLLQLLVNLLCRQFGVAEAVFLDVPAVSVDQRAFPMPLPRCGNLPEQLMVLGSDVAGDEMRIESAAALTETPSVTILVGPALEPRSKSDLTLVAYGHGWNAFCAASQCSPQGVQASLVPFGPLLTACLAAGAVFRHFYQVYGRETSDCGLWSFRAGSWEGRDIQTLSGVRLPAAHIIGLGAVGAAFSLAVASAPEIEGDLVGIDPQTTDDTGRNRLLSALHEEIEVPKVRLAARLFESTKVHFYPNQMYWPNYAAVSNRESPALLRQDEDAFRYAWVISCVDRNIHRQNIARYLPRHVLSGSTDGLVAQATYCAMDGSCECLACNHPVPKFSIEQFSKELRSLSPRDRLAWYESKGLASAAAAIDEYLFNPSCGHVAEAELRRLGIDGMTDWSVGFVSAAAGIVLAAYFVRCAMDGVDATVSGQSERRLIFLRNQELVRSSARRKPGCEICGDASSQARFRDRWLRKSP